MNFKEYSVAVIAPLKGVNGAQLAELKRRLAFIGHLLPEDGIIKVTAIGFGFGPNHEVSADILNAKYVSKVQISTVRGPNKSKPISPTYVQLLGSSHDEVWCFAGPGQDGVLSLSRVAQIYHMGVATNRAFKLIPTWWMTATKEKENGNDNKQRTKRGKKHA